VGEADVVADAEADAVRVAVSDTEGEAEEVQVTEYSGLYTEPRVE
jgi:hypothetical protein